jgi:BirA family biotin operon repressor/biotin-[acetyl-CoA-carboxylase] ligase
MNKTNLVKALEGIAMPKLIFFDEVDSTNEQALKIMTHGVEEYTLLVADSQTAGRGRLGRKWVTTPGSSLAFTIILHPLPDEQQKIGFFSFLGGLAVCLAIENLCQAAPQLKWPNDVLLNEKKTAGILAESAFQGEKICGAALGIGINLQSASVPPPDEVMFPATCVGDHCPNLPDQETFLAGVIDHLIQWRPRILEPEFLQAYLSRLAFVGRKVVLTQPSKDELEGELMGVDRNGYLVLELEDEIKAFPVGDVRLRAI